jgi:cell pole-organizing protein PopZ
MPDQTAQEPTMDEILASIRRIITDDDAPSEGEPTKDSGTSSTTDAQAAESKKSDTAKTSEVEASSAPATRGDASKKSADDTGTVAEKEMPEPKVGDAPEAAVGPDGSVLVSDKAATDTASAFAKLSSAVKESAGETSMSMPAPGRSLEDVVRELLRPILKEWLESHLPEIVREHVEEEVARISRGRAR